MSNDTKPEQDTAGQWAMPNPVFRSSEGHRPRRASDPLQDDIPTEPGFSDDETIEDVVLPTDPTDPEIAESGQSVRATTKTRVRHPKKRSGCAKAFGLIAGAIAFTAVTVVVVLAYFLFFYRSAETSF